MRTLLKLPVAVAVSALLASCGGNALVPTRPYYTSVDKITSLTTGSTIEQTSSTLGISPHQVYHLQGDGTSLVSYNYRLKERDRQGAKNPADKKNHTEISQTDGTAKYGAAGTLYAFFQDGRLKSMVTENGVNDSENLIVDDNTIRFVGKNGVTHYTFLDFGIDPLDSADAAREMYIVPLDKAGIINTRDAGRLGRKGRRNIVRTTDEGTSYVPGTSSPSLEPTRITKQKAAKYGRTVGGILLAILLLAIIL